MGTKLVGDFWLTLHIRAGGPAAQPAATLLRAQILLYNRLGHHLGLGEEFPRKTIAAALAKGNLPRVYVRCSRCNATAYLSDWLVAAQLTPAQLQDRITQAIVAGSGDRARFMQLCDGDAYISQLLHTLQDDIKETAK